MSTDGFLWNADGFLLNADGFLLNADGFLLNADGFLLNADGSFIKALIGSHLDMGIFRQLFCEFRGDMSGKQFYSTISVDKVAAVTGNSKLEIALVRGVTKAVISPVPVVESLQQVFPGWRYRYPAIIQPIAVPSQICAGYPHESE